MSKKLRKGSKVFIPDIIRYRFSSGYAGAGKTGKVVRVVPKRNCVYVSVMFMDVAEEILWYDLSEVEKK